MSRKHFEAIAESFKKALFSCANEQEKEGVKRAVLAFRLVAEQDNPRFDHARFAKACGL